MMLLSAVFIAIGLLTDIEYQVKLYHEQTDTGYIIYADNDEFCPVSIEIDFKTENLKASGEEREVYVIPPKSKRYKITEFTFVKKGKEVKLSYASRVNFGDHFQSDCDTDFAYYLPFKNGDEFMLWQGYNGAFSHQNENSLDFNMPMGTEIYSARAGIVCKVIESNSRHCKERECAKYNNYIRVYHDDGTFAEYTHIRKDGSIVNEGDTISIGQLIGYSGNVGWASGPHLHFTVFLQRIEKRNTLKTKFLVDPKSRPIYLEEKRTYKRVYE
jgi:murein DD-endopeptidase MepM/ murein hydrolase activator NlpD